MFPVATWAATGTAASPTAMTAADKIRRSGLSCGWKESVRSNTFRCLAIELFNLVQANRDSAGLSR